MRASRYSGCCDRGTSFGITLENGRGSARRESNTGSGGRCGKSAVNEAEREGSGSLPATVEY
jgi:hypothetical protein